LPRFSIITVTFNSAPFVLQTVNSVLQQTKEEFEYIIGDDCSNDDTWEMINQFTDPRIRRYRNDTNLGEYANRNKAVRMATGDYILFIDGDDIIYPHALETVSVYIDSFPDCAMFILREWDPHILYPFRSEPQMTYRFEFLDQSILGGNFTNVIFKSAVLRAHPFPASIRTGDTYMQLTIAQKHPVLLLPSGMTWWRRRKGNATEKLFSNSFHIAEMLNYRIEFINTSPLYEAEKEAARINVYGVYLRILLRMIGKFRFRELSYLLKSVKVPSKYLKTIFIPSRFDYYRTITGDNPLNSGLPASSKQYQ